MATQKANTQDMKNKLSQRAQQTQAPQPQQGGRTMDDILREMTPAVKEALPQHMNAERVIRLAMTTIRKTPRLRQCKPESFLGAIMQASQLGLEPNTPLGEAYIIPYGEEATFQIGYKGLLNLAHRTGEYEAIYAHEVYGNDEFSFQYGLHKDLKHIPADEPEGEPTHYYAVYKLKNGGYDFVAWTTARIRGHATKYSQGFNSKKKSPWDTDFDSMAKKTVLKEVLKYAPKSIEFANAVAADETVKSDLKEEPKYMGEIFDYADDPEKEPEAIEEPENKE